MREIKFRGKAIVDIKELEIMGIKHDNGWVYGNLIKNGDRPIISSDILEEIDESIYPEWWVVVEPESIGQYTGLKDIIGKDIYEGDLLQYPNGTIAEIKYSDDLAAFVAVYVQNGDIEINFLDKEIVNKCKIAGNVYENPELLEVEGEMNEFCPTCNGSGGIDVFDWSAGEVVTITCPDCRGSGELEGEE